MITVFSRKALSRISNPAPLIEENHQCNCRLGVDTLYPHGFKKIIKDAYAAVRKTLPLFDLTNQESDG